MFENKKLKKIFRILLFLGFVIFLFFAIKTIRQKIYIKKTESVWGTTSKNLKFDYHNCDQSGPWISPYVKDTAWIDNDTLLITISVPILCGDYQWIGNYHLEEDRILLQYMNLPSLLNNSACLCHADLDYQINHLEKRDYSIELQKVNLD